jgi:hypothetical protein
MQEVPLRRYHFAEFGSGFGCQVHPIGSKWGVPGLRPAVLLEESLDTVLAGRGLREGRKWGER